MDNNRSLIVDSITKNFGDTIVVNSVSFQVKQGEFLSLLGPSGCGKTTTLRIIAGFIKPVSGVVKLGGVEITHLPPFKRQIGLVFQNYALWPHMSVFENISFGLKLRKFKSKEIKQKVEEVLSLVNLFGMEDRFPRELSGGQQQRVALARILSLGFQELLMDEPLSNLDRKLRVYMRLELKRIQKKLGSTILYVTHDQEEALSMSDRIVVMNAGKIVQVGTPDEIYEKPKNKFIADFIGNINIFEGNIVEASETLATFKTRLGFNLKVPINKELIGLKDNKDILNVVIRPERVIISQNLIEGNNVIEGKVQFKDYHGSSIGYLVEIGKSYQIMVEDQNLHRRFNAGAKVYLKIEPDYCNLIKS